jgi:hypothetical protein
MANIGDIKTERFTTGQSPWIDQSEPAGFGDVPLAPLSAYGETVKPLPTWQTLDYAKQGMWGHIQKLKADPATTPGALDAANTVYHGFVNALDNADPTGSYARGRQAFEAVANQADALKQGAGMFSDAVTQGPFTRQLGDVRAYDAALPSSPAASNYVLPDEWAAKNVTLPKLQTGYASAMNDAVNAAPYGTNPHDLIANSLLQDQKLAGLYSPEGVAAFKRTQGLEGDIAQTGAAFGSGDPATAAIAGTALGGPSGNTGGSAGDALAMEIAGRALTGLPGGSAVSRIAHSLMSAKAAAAQEANASAVAKILYNTTDPAASSAMLANLALTQGQAQAARQAQQGVGGLVGGAVGDQLLNSMVF